MAALRMLVLDIRPIDPPVDGSRRILGLHHDLGPGHEVTYLGSYGWRGPGPRDHRPSPRLREVNVPLSDAYFQAAEDLGRAVGGHSVIDVAFPRFAHHAPELARAVAEAVPAADVVLFSHPWVYPLAAPHLDRTRQMVVYEAHRVEGLLRMDLLDDGAEGSALVAEVVRHEAALCRAADLVLACSQEDRQLFTDLYGIAASRIRVVPNGTFVRDRRIPGGPAKAAARQALGLDERPLVIFMAGRHAPDLEAAELICRELAPEVFSAQFAICGGGGDGPRLERLREAARLAGNVRITGTLSEAEEALYLQAADLAVNPMLSGADTNVKLFDLMALGIPVVATPAGARGIVETGELGFRPASTGDFPAAVRALVGAPEAAARLGRAGRKLVEERHAWERLSPDLGTLLARRWARRQRPAPRFTVVVPTWERPDHLRRLMTHLQAQTFRDFEVIVVDQSAAPWDGRDQYPDLDLFYVHTDLRGAARARNRGASLARGRILAFTDDDCLPVPGWLARAAAYFERPGVMGVEGFIRSDKLDDPNYRTVTNQGFTGLGFMTANFLVRQEAFCRLGGFDERFDNPHFREDTDLGWRVLGLGEVPFATEVEVFHPPHLRQVARESLEERTRFFEQDALLFMKHPERYRELFLVEGHHQNTPGFWANFLRGVAKHGATLDPFLLGHLTASAKKGETACAAWLKGQRPR